MRTIKLTSQFRAGSPLTKFTPDPQAHTRQRLSRLSQLTIRTSWRLIREGLLRFDPGPRDSAGRIPTHSEIPNQHRRTRKAQTRRTDISTGAQNISLVPNSSDLGITVTGRMLVELTFVTTPTSDTQGTALILHAVDRRYMIGNLHEGFQRAALERRSKSGGFSEAFLTGKTEWRKLGGLLGWVLSISDVAKMAAEMARQQTQEARARVEKIGEQNAPKGLKAFATKEPEKQRLGFHGGPNLAHMIATGRRFIFRKSHPIDIHEYENEALNTSKGLPPSWQNDQIRVWAMPISASETPTEPQPGSEAQDEAELQQKRDLRTRALQSIVTDMFDSEWRKDDLAQMSLKEVKLPAAVFVRNQNTHRLEPYPHNVPEKPSERPEVQVLVRKPWPGALVAELPQTRPQSTSLCYVISLPPQRGKFLPKNAKDLKVRPYQFSKLTAGESVTSEDGQTVTPEQVLEPGRIGNGILVAELPTIHYVDGFLSRRELTDHNVTEGIVGVVWILGSGLTKDKRLQNFINEHLAWNHIISCPDHNANHLTFDTAAQGLIHHHMIDPGRFTIPTYDNTLRPLPAALAHCHLAQRGLRIRLQPEFKLESDGTVPCMDAIADVARLPKEVRKLAEAARKDIEENHAAGAQKLPGGENEIITLGTGSALPSTYRNVSATLLRVPGVGSYLLDCGENTLGQLSRMYDAQELQEVLRDLKMIWISHMHADHHLGTTGVIKAWYEAVHGGADKLNVSSSGSDPTLRLKRPGSLFVVAETAMIQWFGEYAAVEDFGYDHLIPLEAFPQVKDGKPSTALRWHGHSVGFEEVPPEITAAMRAATGLSDLAVCSVPHCHGARGVALTFPNGFKFTYSGDARPSLNLVGIGQGSTVLLHEATFDDEMQGDAMAKAHSTTSEAIGVGVAMNAKRVVLTHFSQRYSKIPVMSDLRGKRVVLEETDPSNQDPTAGMDDTDPAPTLSVQGPAAEPQLASNAASKIYPTEEHNKPAKNVTLLTQQASNMKVAVAFDFMRVKVKDIEVLEKFTPAFVELYKDGNDRGSLSGARKAERIARHNEHQAQLQEGRKKKRDQQQALSSPHRRRKSDSSSREKEANGRGDTTADAA